MSKQELDKEDEFLDKLVNHGIDLLKTIVTNPAGLGLIAIAIGSYIKTLPKTKVTFTKLHSQKRYRLSVEGVKRVYGFKVKRANDEFGTDLRRPEYGEHQFRIGRNFTAEEQRCKDLLDAKDIEFDTTCELYEVPGTTIRKEESAGWDPIIDLFPFQLWGLIPKETGEIHLSDALILAGLFAIGGQALSKIP